MIELKVNDMTCGHCVKTVAKAVASIDPDAKVVADLGTKRVRIESTRPLAELTRALGEAGYPAVAAAS